MSKIWTMALIAVLMTVNCVSAGMVSLAYDDGIADDGVWIDEHRGHAVVFTAPIDNWSLSQVAILGKLLPESKSELFVIEVWDQNLSLLHKTTDKASAYFGNNLTWSLVDLPDVKVSGNFIIAFFEFAGVFQGVDAAPSLGRSILVARNPNRILNWSVQNHTQNQTNWMVQAIGYSPQPDFIMKVISDTASGKSPAKIQVKAEDPDGNLKSATIFVVDNKTKDIVWSEGKTLSGSSGEVDFSWPATMFMISEKGLEDGPIYAVNNLDVPENLSSLLAYSAPCILELEKNVTFSARAFFGTDGKFNALIDSYGAAHYQSQDLLDITKPGTDYTQFVKNNISLVKDVSKIGFLGTMVSSSPQEQTTKIIGPIVFSGTPLSNYDLKLERSNVGMGEYIALVKVEDLAFNEISGIGDKTIKVLISR
jgi:hypothetical protein